MRHIYEKGHAAFGQYANHPTCPSLMTFAPATQPILHLLMGVCDYTT